MSKHLVKTHYLENADVADDGSILGNLNGGKPGIIMLQGTFCGHCTSAKPAFQQFHDDGQYYAATIKIDGNDNEKALNKKLSASFGAAFRGVPHYYLINADGSFAGHHTTGRSFEKLNEAAGKL